MSPHLSLEPAALEDLGSEAGFLQSGFWGCYKQKTGQQARPFRIITDTPGQPSHLLVMERALPGGLSLAYIPHGPVLKTGRGKSADYLEQLSELLRPLLSKNCVFLRFDLPWGSEEAGSLETGGSEYLIKAPVDIQPPSTVIIDLSRDEEEILMGMKSKTRYNIRLAEKRGVEVRFGSIDDLPGWYEMYRETAGRDNITIHSYDYYRNLFTCRDDFGGESPEILLLLASAEGEAAAGNIVLLFNQQAVYLYGASLSRKRNCMPTYALQWAAIRAAKAGGCREYDLFGIPPSNAPDHPMHGLYRFKTGFGGRIVHRAGCWDYLLKPGRYRMLRLGEQARDFYFKKLRKR